MSKKDIPEQFGYSGNIPITAVHELEQEAYGLKHGTVMLTMHIKDGILCRYTTSRERSFVSGKPMTGSQANTFQA